MADIDEAASEIVLTIHWVGGVHTEHRLPRRRRGQRNSTSADIVKAVRTPALIARDDVIAGILNRNGLKTGHGNRWTRERVLDLWGDAVFEDGLAAGELLEGELAAFFIELLEAIEAVTGISHDFAGDVAELLGELDQACLGTDDLPVLGHGGVLLG
jgi:hypothetical protein